MRYLVRLLPYMKPYTGRVVATWICVFASGAFVMVSPILVREAINQGLQPIREDAQIVGLEGNERLLIFAALAIVVFAIARGLTAFGQKYLGETVGQHVAYDIRNEIYDNLQRLSYAYHDKHRDRPDHVPRHAGRGEHPHVLRAWACSASSTSLVLVVVAVVGMFIDQLAARRS